MSTRGMVHVVQAQSLGCGETTRPPAQSKVIAAWLLQPAGRSSSGQMVHRTFCSRIELRLDIVHESGPTIGLKGPLAPS